MRYVKQYYRKTGLSRRDRDLMRLEELERIGWPGDEPEVIALRCVLYGWDAIDQIRALESGEGCGGILAPTISPPPLAAPPEPLVDVSCPGCGSFDPCYDSECLHPDKHRQRSIDLIPLA